MTDAEAYERGFARLSAHTVASLLEPIVTAATGPRPGEGAATGLGPHLLDVGCGSGVVTARALALGARVTAVDADPAMVELTARRHPRARVRAAALPELPFADGTFHAVAGNFVINHVPEPLAALRELRRVVRPGGTVALTWWKSDEMTATGLIAEAITAAGVPYEPPPGPFAAVAAPETFSALMREAGFSGVGVRTLRWRHRADPGSWLTDVVAAGGPRFGLIADQPPMIAERIRAHYIRLAAPYVSEGFPVCARLAWGRR
ncbi:class I SAM-dependent methyltransferase [Nonomuraea sp. LPB2021202275-12-8]|uniref:class I SAM-dependent methyltransferase n=1 Tax=Nonomuraea sp. LPB2021202275-12-8 TaxID=3120159 RepID=UPI00300C07DC